MRQSASGQTSGRAGDSHDGSAEDAPHRLRGAGEGGAPAPAEPAFSRKKNPWLFRAGLVLVITSIASGLATYAVLTGLTPIRPAHDVVVMMLRINGLLIAAMLAIVTWQIFGLWRARRRQVAGAGLHVRIVGLFSVVALFPAILLAVFASVSLDRGLDQWFSARTRSIIRDSVEVANAYLSEHGKIIRSDLVGGKEGVSYGV